MSVSDSVSKSARIEARVSLEQKELIERAAAYQGRSVSEFVISNAEIAAKQIVHEYERVQLNREQSQALIKALLSPKSPSKRLRGAVERHHKQVIVR